MRQIYSIPEFYDTVGYQWLEKDEGNRTSRELAIIAKEFSSPSFLVEAGCGYGRIAIPLANKHHRVYAFDSSFEMIQELCNRAMKYLTQRNNLLISKEDLEQPKDLPQNANGILFMWGTFANIEREKQLLALKTYKKALSHKGKILLELPNIDLKEYGKMTCDEVEVINLDTARGVTFIYWSGNKGITFNVPNINGIQLLAEKAGLTIERTYHFKVNVGKMTEERLIYVLAGK